MTPSFRVFITTIILCCSTIHVNSDRVRRVECLAKLLCGMGAQGVNQERRTQVAANFFRDESPQHSVEEEALESLQDYYVSTEDLRPKTRRESWLRSLPSPAIQDIGNNNTYKKVPDERIARAMQILEDNARTKLSKTDECDILGCSFTVRELIEKFGDTDVANYPSAHAQNQQWSHPPPPQLYQHNGGQYQPRPATIRNSVTNQHAQYLYGPPDYHSNDDTFDDEAVAVHDMNAHGGISLKGDVGQGTDNSMKTKQLWDFRPRPPPPPPPFWEVKRPEGFFDKPEDPCGGGKKGKKGKKGGKKGKKGCKKGKKGKGKKGKKGKKGGGWTPSSSEEEENRFYRRLHYFLAEQKRIDAHKASLSWRIGGRPMAVQHADVPVSMTLPHPHYTDFARPVNTAISTISRIFSTGTYGEHNQGWYKDRFG